MSIRDKAVEAGARALAHLEPDEDWPTNAELGGGPTGTRDDEYRSETRDESAACIRAALAVLHPTVPNDVAALDALPAGTVLRGVDQDGTAWLLHPQESFRAAGAVLYFEAVGVTEWLVIYQPEEGR